MHFNEIDLSKFQTNKIKLRETTTKINIADVFADRQSSYLNEFTFFLALFGTIPNFIHEVNINCKKANEWFLENYKNDIKDVFYNKRYLNKNSKTAEYDDIFYILHEDLIIDFDTTQTKVRFLFRSTKITDFDPIISGIRKFRERKSRAKPKIFILYNTSEGLSTRSLHITKPKLNIEDNYNDDFKEIHEYILKRLSRKNDKGLVLLHGKPGTGKTSYIRFLVSRLKKNIIFLPPNMAGSITSPSLISILIDNPNSIFVIEDAENIIVDREKDGNSPVSALLNISDGLLSDCLNIQIICSFNTDISKVDSALMRKGRLIAKYEFRELETNKAQMLSQKLGLEREFHTPMTLTAIYNHEEKEFLQARHSHSIGFRAANQH